MLGIERLVRGQLAADLSVVRLHLVEKEQKPRHQQAHDPGALEKLRDQHDDQRHAGANRPGGIDRPSTCASASPRNALPVRDHPGLREREGQECPDGEQRDQVIGDPAERDQDPPRKHRQDEDALRIDQPAARGGQSSLGRKPSCAITRQSRGKSAKPVLADSASTASTEPIVR